MFGANISLNSFIVSNTPRLILNFYEFFINEAFQEASNPSTSNCFPLPHWVLVTTSISLVLITSNASTNFFIYCFVNTAFREELHRYGRMNKMSILKSSTSNEPDYLFLTDVQNYSTSSLALS